MKDAAEIAQQVLDNHVIRDDWRRTGAQVRQLLIEAVELDREQRTIEILHRRDPDSGCEHTVFVDGEPTDRYTCEDIDPGAGYERSDWDDRIAEVPEGYSPTFRAATLAALTESSDSPYITEGES